MGRITRTTKRNAIIALIVGLIVGGLIALANSGGDDNTSCRTAYEQSTTDGPQFLLWLEMQACE